MQAVSQTYRKLTLAFKLKTYPPPCIQKKTGSFEFGVASDGAQTFKNKQSSLMELDRPEPTPKQIGPKSLACWTPSIFTGGWGFRKRKFPRGGAAKRIPRNWF